MITFDGQHISPQNNTAPSLETIALSLARQCRFGGQIRQWYCVLAHSFLVSDLCRLAPNPTPSHYLVSLLHDAGESVCGDIPTPWKTEADNKRENEILSRIYDSLGLQHMWPLTIDLAKSISYFDLLALRAEATLLMPLEVLQKKHSSIEPILRGQMNHWEYYALKRAKYYIISCEYNYIENWLAQGGLMQTKWIRNVQKSITMLTV